MITDDLCATIEELLPKYSRELDVRFDISWSLQSGTTPDGHGTVYMTLFQLLFVCPSPLVGAPPISFVESLPLEVVLQTPVLEQLLTAVTEQMRTVRFQLLGVPRA